MTPKTVVWILLCLLMTSTGLAEHGVVHAQGVAPGWVGPEDISHPLTEGRDLNGVLVCDAYQNLHIFWGKGHVGGSEIYYRTDQDGSLSYPMDVLATSNELAVGLSVAVTASDNIVHLVWKDRYIQGSVYYSRAPLADAMNARSWDEPRLLTAPAESVGIHVDTSGVLHLIYTSFEGDGYRAAVYHMLSVDSGLTWSEPAVIYDLIATEPSYLLASAAIDEAGRMHVGITQRSQEYGVYFEVGYLRSPDTGQTWHPYQVVAQQNEVMPLISDIAAFAFGEGEIHLTWHNPRRMHMWSSDGGQTWSDPVEIIQLDAGFGGLNYLAKDSAGVLRVATSVNSGVFVSTLHGSRWLAHERIESRNMDPHGQQLVVCQGNRLHLIYDDRLLADTTVWYAYKEVDAPHIGRSPIPTPIANSPVAAVTPQASPTPPTLRIAADTEFTSLPIDVVPPPIAESALAPFVIPMTLVVVTMTVVWVWRRVERR
jgi:hypothetical protein